MHLPKASSAFILTLRRTHTHSLTLSRAKGATYHKTRCPIETIQRFAWQHGKPHSSRKLGNEQRIYHNKDDPTHSPNGMRASDAAQFVGDADGLWAHTEIPSNLSCAVTDWRVIFGFQKRSFRTVVVSHLRSLSNDSSKTHTQQEKINLHQPKNREIRHHTDQIGRTPFPDHPTLAIQA